MLTEFLDIISTLAMALFFFVTIVILALFTWVASFVSLALLVAFAFWLAICIAVVIAALLFFASQRRPRQFFFPLADVHLLPSVDRRRPDHPPSLHPAGALIHGEVRA